MKLLFFLVAGCTYSQTCQYQMVSMPSGSVQVYQNGLLLRQVADYSYVRPAGLLPRINPVKWSAGDKFTVVYPHRLSLSSTVNGITFPYFAYQAWQEIWDCPGTAAGVTKLNTLEQCSGSGNSPQNPSAPAWDSTISYPISYYVNYGVGMFISTQVANIGNQPDTSPAWWKFATWDCAGILRASIIRADGSNLVITGTSGEVPGGNWTSIK